MHKNKLPPTQKFLTGGFTLLEILVVVSIIGILIAIGMPAFSTAQMKGRDAARRAGIKAIQNGFEQYYAQNNSVYAACATLGASSIFPAGLPTDPRGTYVCTGNATSYCACALLEAGNGNATTSDCTTMSAPATTNTYFCLKNMQ